MVHQSNGWSESAANDGWGGVGSGGQKWGEAAEAEEEEASGYEGWGDAESKYQPAAQNMGKNYTAEGMQCMNVTTRTLVLPHVMTARV